VAHTDLDRGELLLTTCRDTGCDQRTTRVLDRGPRSGNYPSLRLDRDRPVVAYQDSGGGRLVVRRCADPACTRSTAAEAPLPTGLGETLRGRFGKRRPGPLARNLSMVPRLALDRGVPVVAFAAVGEVAPGSDTPPSEVWVDRCTDASCRSWTSHRVAEGAVPSLALSPDGRPVVAGSGLIIENLSFGSVWIATCRDPACAAADVTTTSTAASTVSVAVHPDGTVSVAGMSYSAATEPDGVWVVSCPAGCPAASVTAHKVAERSQPDGYPSLSVDGPRNVVVFRSRNEDLPGIATVWCDGPDCSTAGQPVPVNSLVPEDERTLGGGDDPNSAIGDGVLAVSSSKFPAKGRGAKLVVSDVPLRLLRKPAG
jgi:hypothetical protein